VFDKAIVLRNSGGTVIDLVTGASSPLDGEVAVSAQNYDNALEARIRAR